MTVDHVPQLEEARAAFNVGLDKYLEINTGRSLLQIRQDLWQVHEAQIRDERTGETYVLQMDVGELANSELMKLINSDYPH